jgi:hypothetical protein
VFVFGEGAEGNLGVNDKSSHHRDGLHRAHERRNPAGEPIHPKTVQCPKDNRGRTAFPIATTPEVGQTLVTRDRRSNPISHLQVRGAPAGSAFALCFAKSRVARTIARYPVLKHRCQAH